MADVKPIKGFMVSGTPRYIDAKYVNGKEISEDAAETLANHALKGIYVNPSNNLEINSSLGGGEKLNLVAADAVQIKPGDGEPLQLDCENNLTDVNEFGIKVCNGSMDKAVRVVGLKLNAAELTLDTQKANSSEFDIDEFNIKARYDKWNGGKVVGNTGPIYVKMKGRAFDIRCHDHGGIALQVAGADSGGHENKIKFESDRTTVPGASSGNYCGEGGKGLEFGTFNNEHSSLYTGDYRFKGDAPVYGVTRNTPEMDTKGKTDYPTQGDDFKDVIDAATPHATWNEIIDAAKQCKNLDEKIQEELAKHVYSGTVDPGILDVFVTRSEVNDVVASAMSEAHIDLSGVATKEWVLDKHYIDALPEGLEYVGMGSSKGNFQIDVTGRYTWEQTGPKSATTVDEYGTPCGKGARVVKFVNDLFYSNPEKVYYKASIDTTFADGTSAKTDDIVYNVACNLVFNLPEGAYKAVAMRSGDTAFYEDTTKFVYKGTKNISIKYNETTPIKKKEILEPSKLSAEELAYYDSQVAVYDEDGKLVSGWEKVNIWVKNTLWTKNEININLETDSKIKFAGKKIETVWTVDDVDKKMDEILLSTENLAADATQVVFEQKISKNGDRSGQDTDIVYSFGNNVADPEKVADFAAFKANYNSKHTPKSDEELQAMYDAFLAEGPSYEIRVKISDLLKLVERVNELEMRVAALEGKDGE